VLCPSCQSENLPDALFCVECGSRIEQPCQTCGATNPPGSKFCRKCGKRIVGEASAPQPKPLASSTDSPSAVRVLFEGPSGSGAPSDGERKTVTALFADIKGSTELMEDLDPEEARAIVDPALRLMIEAVHRYGGYIVQSTGDGIFALFGAPIAHEDHPQRALYAALRMQEETRRYGDNLRAQGGAPVEIRVGVNTGEVVIRSISTSEGHVEYTPIGHTTNLASRMQAIARTGSILTSEHTQRLAEGYFQTKALGPVQIRGMAQPVVVFEVAGLGPLRTRLQVAARRGLTKFVGRESELAQMRRALESARAGHGQLVAAIGDPGVGKSRLFFEFKVIAQSGCLVLEALSVSHGKASAYLPVIDLLKGYFKIATEDDERTRREKVAGKVTILDRSLEDTLPYLFGLLGIVEGDDPLAQMDGQIKRRRTLDAIKRVLLRESMNQPLMVISEDLHWIDEQTQALLNLLADSIGTAKILLLVNYRPEYSHQWGSKTYYTQLRLDPLGKESADEMLLALLGDGRDLEPLKRVIIEKTEGNPFFMEETVQVLLDEGALVRHNGTVKLTRPVGELKIPPTVQGILAARIDRLPPDTKELLQTLSVIGREFPMSLIRAVVTKSDDELNRMLGDLQLAEFIYEQPAVGDTQYIFKHALTQEVSHNSVLLERRRQLHERIGGAIETVFAANLEDHLAELAHHYSRSASRAKALEFLHRAGEQAFTRSYSEAESYLTAALEVVSAMPDSPERDALELRLLSSLVQALGVTKGWFAPQVLDMNSRTRALAEKTGNLSELVQQLWVMTAYAQHRGDCVGAVALADQTLETAQREGSPISLGLAHQVSIQTRFYQGDFVGAEQYFARGGAFTEGPGFAQIGSLGGVVAGTFGVASWNAWITGHADAARERVERMRRVLAGAQRDLYATGSAQIAAANLHAMLREFARAEILAGEALASCEEHGLLDLAIYARIALGLGRAELGRPADGVALLRQALAVAREMGTRLEITRPLTYLAQAQWLDDAVTDALRTIDDALQANPQELFLRPETLRVRGELRLRQGDSGTAEADFREANALAQKLSAKAWELRATVSLARLLRQQGKVEEARKMLGEIYNWFTEGFDTADLKDAKALLDELGE
jgi:class 3 adenylate cyclase/tetratricopeptide (TPR) repeat protein